jgi:hypothetical protein
MVGHLGTPEIGAGIDFSVRKLLLPRAASGVDISRHVEERLRSFAPEVEIHFIRVAVNDDQIKDLHMSTRPTKATDSRSAKFRGESVEIDAIDPNTLRSMVKEVIMGHIDDQEINRLETIEKAERETLAGLAAVMRSKD